MDAEIREALERLERGLREEIQASPAATHQLIAGTRNDLEGQIAATRSALEGQIAATRNELAETRRHLEGQIAATRSHFEVKLAESAERTRRHFDVVAESLRADNRALAEGVMAVAEGSMRRDAELGGRVDRLEHRVLGLESRVSDLEQPRPPRRRRR